jgi:hypothetical protein
MLNRIDNIRPDHAEKDTELNTTRKIALQNKSYNIKRKWCRKQEINTKLNREMKTVRQSLHGSYILEVRSG